MRVDLDIIKRIVCEKYNIDLSRLFMQGRKRNVVGARQAFAYLAYDINKNLGYESLGDYMGLNHATVLHACKQIRGYIEFDKSFRIEIAELYEECLKHSVDENKIKEFDVKLVARLMDKLLICKSNEELKDILEISLKKI